jgi:hypothetical protein
MHPVKEATNIVNEVLKLVGEEPISIPTDGTTKQRLEALLNIYTDKLVIANPKYKCINNNRDIPDMVVNYLVSMIDKH